MKRDLKTARAIIRDMLIDSEQSAISGLKTWTGKAWVFNDRIWRDEMAGDFEIAERARTFLGLKAFACRSREASGIEAAWQKLRFTKWRKDHDRT